MHEDIINRYIQSYNDRDIEGMLDCVTEDVIFENILNIVPLLVECTFVTLFKKGDCHGVCADNLK